MDSESPLSPEELSRLGAKLSQSVVDSKDAYAKAKATAQRWSKLSQDVGLKNVDGPLALRKACQFEQFALRRYTEAVKALTDFVLYQKSIRDLGSVTVPHRPGTTHFRCPCGTRLVFSQHSTSYTPLANLKMEGKSKMGECPRCGVVHCVREFEPRLAG